MAAGSRYGVDLRAASPADAADLAALFRQLGHPADSRAVATRLDGLARDAASAVLVATGWNGAVIGTIALHWYPTLQAERPIAMITALVVDEAERGRGVGRLLLKAGAQAARVAGCDVLEIALDEGREAARGFCRALGFVPGTSGFSRPLRKRSQETVG